MMKYNYIFFNTPDKFTRVDKDGYYSICVEDLRKLNNVRVISCPLEHKSVLLRKMHALHVSDAVNDRVRLPFKKVWFPHIFDESLIEVADRTCFISLASYISSDYLDYLKRRYPMSKYVMLRRDLIHLYQKRHPEWTNEWMHRSFDIVMSYDKYEAERYGMIYFNEFESKIRLETERKPADCEVDVFFAGLAKDRLGMVMEAYDIFASSGLKCDFYLVGVPAEKRERKEGVKYADSFMPYKQMLERTVNAKCVLEINQKGAVGYTSRFLEAIMYGRKLITNNTLIRDTQYYDSRQIQCVDRVGDINPKFVREDCGNYHYDYKDEFSPVRLIEQIDGLLP